MSGGRPLGDMPGRRRSGRPGEDGLRALGDMVDGGSRRGAPAGRPETAGAGAGAPAAEERLRALGERVASSGGRGRGGGRVASSGGRGGGRRRKRWSTRRKVVTSLVAVVVLLVVMAAGLYGYARYRYDQIKKVHVASEVPVASGAPFNMLVIGSDTRVGNAKGTAKYGTSTLVGGQRSDVDMIWHLDPATKRISMVSIPRDTLVSMVGKNVTTFGRFNRINASFNSGPTLLVKTIEDNFGIPISHVVQVDFGGLMGAVNALGGIHMNFNYPTRTWNATTGVNESGLNVGHGCQLLNGTQALAVARSRHYEYDVNGSWQYTPTGDLGRIKRQDAFLKALIDEAKTKYNPFTLNALIGSIPQGIQIDTNFSLNDLIGLAESFHSISPTTIQAMTLPTTSVGYVTPWGDVLFVTQPGAQQMLVSVFGSELTHPTSPPPNTTLVPQTPPAVTASSPTPASGAPVSAGVTSAPAPPSFDPTPCA